MTREHILSVTIHDCEVQTFRAGGKGGQNQNKRETGVRVIHHPSGARAESREERSQAQNKRAAFLRMTETGAFKVWLTQQLLTDNQILRINEKYDLRDDNIKIEVRSQDGWVEDD